RRLKAPSLVITTFSIHLRNNLVSSGNFITALPRSVLRIYRKCHALKELPIDLSVHPPVAVVTLRNRTLSHTVQLFIQCAPQVAKSGDQSIAIEPTRCARRQRCNHRSTRLGSLAAVRYSPVFDPSADEFRAASAPRCGRSRHLPCADKNPFKRVVDFIINAC